MLFTKLDLDDVRSCIKDEVIKDPEKLMKELENLQIVIYVMCGGRYLGHNAVTRPKTFSIVSKVTDLPYSEKAIFQAVAVLRIYAEELGLNPDDLKPVGNFHYCGIF